MVFILLLCLLSYETGIAVRLPFYPSLNETEKNLVGHVKETKEIHRPNEFSDLMSVLNGVLL